ncbi:MAG: efflux RND transporter permease subunit [Tepidanaerobacteraceae bacterium]|jgi:HAE1 family hydrophobic/amphiphilic exporter-1|nr:efflux RND transporter permease subunit [Tepidanaerobacteraceae bacterium]
MNLTSFSIKRPVTMLMIIAIVLVLGFISFTRLGIDLFPNFVYPGAVVITQYEGASPSEIETMITQPMEEALSTINNVKNIQSFSNEGSSTVFVEFNWGTNMDMAALDMREQVDLIKPYLPKEAGTPMVVKFDPSMMPVMQLALYGGNDIVQLKKIADDVIKNRLLRLEGVAEVGVIGGLEREIDIVVDPDKLAYYGLSMPQIAAKLQAENMNLPGGTVSQGKKSYLIRTTAQFKDISEIENIPLSLPGGGIIPLKSLAEIKDTHKEISTIARYNGKPSITLIIRKQSGCNTVQVARNVRAEMERIKKVVPEGIGYVSVMDQAEYIEKSIGNVASNAVTGALLAVLVLYLFLRNLRTTVIIGVSIPISIIATFVLIYFNRLTLNMMSLGGLALGVGMLVDNSIVVLENIFRHRQEGEEAVAAAVSGANEVGMAVTASTLTTVAVFLPIVFVQGITAQFFKEMALTVTFSLLSSLAVALTVVPLFSSRLMHVAGNADGICAGSDSKNVFFRFLKAPLDVFSRCYEKTEAAYGRLLKWSLFHRKLIVVLVGVLFILSLVAIPLVGTEFMPKSDAGMITVSITMPDGTNLEETDSFVSQMENKLKKIEEIKGMLANVGSSSSFMGNTSQNIASIAVMLKPLSERKRGAQDVAEEIRSIAQNMPGAQVKVDVMSSMDFGGGGSMKPISISIKGDDFEELKKISDRIVEIVRSVPGTREVESSLERGKPELNIVVDREKAALYGLSTSQVAQAVNSAVAGSTATKYKVGGDEIDVVIKAREDLVDEISKIRNLLVQSASGAMITLGDVARVEKGIGPVEIDRDDQTRVVTVTGDVVGRAAGTVNSEIQKKLSSLRLPEGYSYKMGGEQEQMMESFRDLFLALILAVILVYMVMAAQFESLSQPFVIMFTVPLAVIGVVFALLATGRHISMPAFIGIIMLAGIVVNNAIVLVDFINQLRHRGMSREEAIIKAGPTRLRPILMTTLTTVLGLIPLALGLGEGGELRAPMATAVIGGLAFSTLLTLVVIPVIYTIMEDIGSIWKRMGFAKRRKLTSG